jgi:glycosyltransferase involved in cell wall biosynthesis
MLPIQKRLARWARLNIVTNQHHRSLLEAWGGEAVILDDVPARLPEGVPFPMQGPANIAVISSFAPDEPLATVIAAVSELPGVHFYITGDSRRAPRSLLARVPENVTFTGFLPDEEYFGLLRGVDAVMVLTTRDHTNQRGACEAVWLGQPLITSDWPILRELFHLGTVHVPNTSDGVRSGVLKALQDGPTLSEEMRQLQDMRREAWRALSHKMRAVLE